MAKVWTTIADVNIDAKSPITDGLMEDFRDNDQYLKAVLEDGATAPTGINTDTLTASKATGDGLTVISDSDLQGNVDIGGNLVVSGTISGADVFQTVQIYLLMC